MALSVSIFSLYNIQQYQKNADLIIFFSCIFKIKKNFRTQFLVIWSVHKPFLGSCEVPNEGPDRLIRLLDTNGQTDTKTSKVYNLNGMEFFLVVLAASIFRHSFDYMNLKMVTDFPIFMVNLFTNKSYKNIFLNDILKFRFSLRLPFKSLVSGLHSLV